jgi:hypothetical protein
VGESDILYLYKMESCTSFFLIITFFLAHFHLDKN